MTQFLKKQWLFILLAVLGIILLALPQFLSGDSDSGGKPAENSVEDYENVYAEKLEKRLSELILSMHDVDSANVMLTLESGDETVYAEDNSSSGESNRTDYVILGGGSDGENAVPVRKVLPKVRGVAVVCRGRGGSELKAEIVSIICASLGVLSNRVCVTLQE